jgi:hypothetical protein
MRRAPALAGTIAMAAALVSCGGGHTARATTEDRECAAITGAANGIQLVDPRKATQSDVDRSATAATALTDAAAAATTAVATSAGQLAAAARSYAAALSRHNVEAANTAGGLLRQRAQAVANDCRTLVLGVAPEGPTS